MAEFSDRQLIRKPVSILQRPIKVDWKSLVKSGAKTAIAAPAALTSGNWDNVAKETVDLAGALGLDTQNPGELAWQLVFVALREAVLKRVSAVREQFGVQSDVNFDLVEERIEQIVSASGMPVSRDLFERPRTLPVLKAIQPELVEWLCRENIPEGTAARAADLLPTAFVYALHAEWQRHASAYKPIEEEVYGKFGQAVDVERGWAHYLEWLQLQLDKDLFEQDISLKRLYVPLRGAYLLQDGVHNSSRSSPGKEHSLRKRVVQLERELDSWIDKPNPAYAIRIISGGPGSGKSSLARMYAAHRAGLAGRRVLYIPLHEIDVQIDFDKAIGDFLSTSPALLRYNPLSSEHFEENILIILDGLDELESQGKSAAEAARQFVHRVERYVHRCNDRGGDVRVILTGREVVVQASETDFCVAGQVLEVLPYWIRKEARQQYDDPDRLLDVDQRRLWWTQYADAKKQGSRALPSSWLRGDLQEITVQPLLNYLLALSYGDDPSSLDEVSNINQIYSRLLERVYGRDWGPHRHAANKSLTREDFEELLEEIGLAAWHTGRRTVTVREIVARCETAGLIDALEVFRQSPDEGVRKLLLAFFFRRHGRLDGEDSFEFTHKTFGEYLTARRIVRGIKTVSQKLGERQKSRRDGWGVKESLAHWLTWFGPAPIELNIVKFLRGEMQLASKDALLEWQQSLVALSNEVLRSGMIFQGGQHATFGQMLEVSRNAEELLLVAAHACALVTKERNEIEWPDLTSAARWISRVGAPSGSWRPISEALQYISFRYQHLDNVNLSAYDLAHADLTGVRSFFGSFVMCNFSGAIVSGARLVFCDLRYAKFIGANLNGAMINACILTAADVSGADLRRTDLESSDVHGLRSNDETLWD